ncbi:MarR family winged helix-turn-helix transcriptional regulator [Albibacillus kandeliae]|jgi:DNA-binding MarR family transcriptional regulator|uniref:MarR family winged helix-turn-helix transcriptional regulator n=1 Tax=Albibacillus kandeliae TaxID=2174228 RepID=UPI000D68F864|nr:MarR family transcriptional regulator [Albibacillus kandeliae]
MPDPDDAVPPYVLDDQIGFLLRLANQRHTAIFQKQMLQDLTPMQFSAMVRLLEIGECSQNELGRQVGMDIATTKGVVDRLRAKGLIDARPDPSDKRRALLSVAEEHLGLRAPLHAAGHAITDATLAPLSKAERAKLLQLIRKLT